MTFRISLINLVTADFRMATRSILMIKQIGRILIVLAFSVQRVFGQTETSDLTNPYVLSVEEDILNLKVKTTESRETYAASRDAESVLETVTSNYLITADEIRQSGAINLGEVLRLSPGVLVKQKTNGYFEVLLRGNYGAVNHQDVNNFENTNVLLTINGIPLNNQFQGGIMWEGVPVELHDIQQIEIIPAPSTVFFGPNATGGVINIVTKRVEERNLQAKIGLQGSLNENYVHRGSASFGISDKLRFRVSGYYNRLTRFQDDYYLLDESRYIQSDSLLHYQSTARQTNTSSEKSLRNDGITASAIFQPNKNIDIEASVGAHESFLQSVLRPLDRIVLTNRDSDNSVFTLRTRFRNLTTTIAYQSGTQDLAVGYEGLKMHSENIFSSVGYGYTGRFYQLNVGGDFNYAIFENTLPLTIESIIASNSYANRVLLGKNRFYKTGLYVSQRAYLLSRKWKWQAAVRADLFDITRQLYPSYRVGTAYQLGKKHQLRASTSFGTGNLTAQNYLYYDPSAAQYRPDQDLRPHKVQTYEAGYRIVPISDLYADFVYFRSESSHFINPLESASERRTNDNRTSLQQGATLDVRWSVNKLTASASLTVQQTKVISESHVTTDSFVPGSFGGVTGSYRTFLNKLKVNASLYFYGNSQLVNESERYVMPKKLIANCKVSYNIWDEHVVYFNGRNVLNSKKVEYLYADQVKSLYMVGIDLTF